MKVDIAIITIREDEFIAVRRHFETEERNIPNGRTYLIGEVKAHDEQIYTIAIARCNDQGNDASQRLAHYIIQNLNPKLILVVGIAGGIPHDEFTLGDVVLSTRIINPNVDAWLVDGTTTYITRSGFPHPLIEDITSLLPGKPQLIGWAASIQPDRPGFDPARANIEGDDAWIKKVRESLDGHFGKENQERESTYISGSIISSNHLMKDPGRLRDILKTHRDILAVEMEVAGVYEAAYGTPSYPVLAIRGISDVVGLKRDKRWTTYACQAAAAFTYAFIMTNPLKLQGTVQTPDRSPYYGLGAFAESDHDFFFGRERDTNRLLEKLRGGSHFMAILGPSGSGKSSLVQAGLIVELRKKGALSGSTSWEFITSRPANDPFAQLEEKGLIGSSNNLLESVQAWRGKYPEKGRLVLVIDQFEELWTSCSPEVALKFVTQLTQLLKAPYHEYLTLIVIMRNDFYSYSVKNGQFAELMEQGTINILPELRRSEFVDIIQKPASLRGMQFADGLVDTIVEGILKPVSTSLDGDRYGPITILPLLEFALSALWGECKRRQDEELTHSAYSTIHGVSGALALWAEDTYKRLEESLQPLARHIFTNLVHLDDWKTGLPKSRVRRILSELCPINSTLDDVHRVVYQLAKDRLLVANRDNGGQEWVEIIHDVLLEKWDSLKTWLDEDRPFLFWHQELQKRFQLWVESDINDPLLRDEGRLLRGRDLDEAELWMAERGISFDPMEQDFIIASRKHVERQYQALVARQLAAQAELIQNQKPYYLQRSMLLAVEAMLHFPCLEADQALRSRLALFPRSITCLQHDGYVNTVAFSPDGRYLATGSSDHTAQVWEVPTGREVAGVTHGRETSQYGSIYGTVKAVIFSPDGRFVASASDDQTVRVWETVSGQEVARMKHGAGYVGTVIFSPDGSYLATASGDYTARIWKITGGEEVARLTHQGIVNAVAFSPDGRYLATGSNDGTAQVLDTVSLEVIEHIRLGEIENDSEKQALNAVAFSPDGHYLAVGGRKDILDGIVVIWETNSRTEVRRIIFKGVDGLSVTHQAAVNALAFSPDSASLVTANEDWMAHLCDVATGRQLRRFAHQGLYHVTNTVYDIAFSPDGRYLATASGDSTAGIWETQSGRQIACLTHDASVHAVVFSPDGRYLATASNDRTARIWEVFSKSSFPSLSHDGPVYAAAFSPNGLYLTTGSQDGAARLWNNIKYHVKEKTVANCQVEASMPHHGSVRAVAFSPNGLYLATASGDRSAGIWHIPSGELIVYLKHEKEVVDVTFSPDSRYLATASSDETAFIWEIERKDRLFRLIHYGAITAIAFSPDGKYIASVSEDCIAKIWEMTSGECKSCLIHDYFKDAGGNSARLLDVNFSPDGRYLATAGGDFMNPGAAEIWNVSSGTRHAHLLHELEVRVAVFSPDGHYLATASNDWTAGIWEVSSGRRLASLAHEKAVHAVAFSSDGNYLATASLDGTAGIWEVPNGRQLARMTHESEVYSAIFSPDDTYMITASKDGTAKVWLWKPQDLINEASSRLTYDLTPEEWRVYLGDEPYRKTRYCPLQEQTKVEERKTNATEDVDMGSENDEIGLFIAQIRRGHPTRASIERLQQYGVVCLERLIEETKMIRGGDSGTARDEVFANMNVEDAFPIAISLMHHNDREIRLVAALSLCRFKYKDIDDIDNAIGAIGFVLRQAVYDGSSEGDKWRLDEAIHILRERRESEFNIAREN